VVFEGPAPDATVVMFVYDERPCLNLVRSIMRDYRRWPNLVVWDWAKDALIDRARSAAASRWFEGGHGDVLVMIDHDIGWEEGDLEHLVRACHATRGVVGAFYPKRGFGHGTAVRLDIGTEVVVGTDVVVEAEVVSTGFFAIHREVLAAMVGAGIPKTERGGQFWPFFLPEVVEHGEGTGDYEELSEDWAFCQRAREVGRRVFVDCKPTLSHFGSHLYTMADSQRRLEPDPGPLRLRFFSGRELFRVPGIDRELDLYLDPYDDVISARLRAGEPWEPEVALALRAVAREDGRSRLLEIGAHLGYFTLQAAAWYRHVTALEPLPHLFTLLRRNLDNAGRPNVDLSSQAVTDRRGTVRMHRDYNNPGASSLVLMGGIEVPSVTLGDLYADAPVPWDVLKLDAEGAEWLILKDHGELLRRYVRAIVFEYNDQMSRIVSGVPAMRVIEQLQDLGFEVRSCREGLPVSTANLPPAPAYTNLVARRE
jgi:FkbM family methyltransferase